MVLSIYFERRPNCTLVDESDQHGEPKRPSQRPSVGGQKKGHTHAIFKNLPVPKSSVVRGTGTSVRRDSDSDELNVEEAVDRRRIV